MKSIKINRPSVLIVTLLINIIICGLIQNSKAQNLLSEEIIRTETNFGSNIIKPNSIFFNAVTNGSIPNGVYHISDDETITVIEEGVRIQFEYNGYLYMYDRINHALYRMNLIDNSSSLFFNNPNVLLISQRIVEYLGKFYFVGYDLIENKYAMMSLDEMGNLLVETYFTGPVQNTNRLHKDDQLFYFFTNTLFPNATHYYSFDPASGIIQTITQQEYNEHPYPYSGSGIQSIDVSGVTYEVNNNSQLSYNSDGGDLTCFNISSEGEGPASLEILGNIGSSIYLLLNNNFGSTNGLYRYPESSNSGLCDDTCNQDTIPPNCNSGPFTVQLDPGQDYYTFDINDFVSDDCSPILTYENASLDPNTPNGTSTLFWSGSDDQFHCGTYSVTSSFPFDDAGNYNDCVFEFTVECEDVDTCSNTVLSFTSKNEYVTLPDVSVSTDFTLGAWVKPSDNNNGGAEDRIFAFGPSNRLEIGLVESGELWIYDYITGLNQTFTNIRDGEWHHIAYVSKGDTDRRLYLDYELVHSYEAGPANYGSSFRLGNWMGGPSLNESYSGLMDEVRMYNYAMPVNDLCLAMNGDPVIDDALRIYFDFEDGIPGENNTSIASVMNKGQLVDGELMGFELIGNMSNFICEAYENCLDVPEECTDECQVENVDLSTGVDFNDGSLFSIGEYDGGWVMVSGPDMTLNYPQPGFVLTPDGAWSNELNAQFISPFANTDNNMSFPEPYTFERQFCICEGTDVQLDIAALFDNYIEVGLYDDSGNLIEQLINQQSNSVDNFQIPTVSNTTHQLLPGVYSIKAGLRNDSSTSMGMAIEATLSGVGLIESGCCSPFQYITGSVFEDLTCDSLFNLNSDPIISDIVISLCDFDGQELQQSITDAQGFYTFFNIKPGNYIVKQAEIADLTMTLGSGGYQLNIEPNTVSSNIDFGNCSDPCAVDSIDPICISQDVAITLNQNGRRTINANAIDNGSSDNCGDVSLEINQTLFTCEDLGDNDVVLTVTDSNGNTSECMSIVTVLDTIAPTLNCDSQFLVFELDSSGEIVLSLEDLEVSLEDECDDSVNIEFSQNLFTCSDLGSNTIEILATDNSGNAASCKVEVDIVDMNLYCSCLDDNIAPLITCGNKVVVYTLDANGFAQLDLSLHDIETFDECGVAQIIPEFIEFDCSMVNLTPQTMVVTVIDLAGNTDQCEISYVLADLLTSCIPEECDPSCYTGSLDLSTGINNLGQVLPIGEYVGNWQLIDGPDDDVDYPRPGFVLNPNNVWAQLPGSQYISPFPNASNNRSFSEPYLFERCFCICEEEAEIDITLSAHVDNFINVGLYDDSGTLIEEFIDYQAPASTQTFLDPPFISNTSHNLSQGTYCLRAGMRNDGSVTMGMQINASITSAGFESAQCCTPYTFILGTVFEDSNCDSVNNLNADIGLEGIVVNLLQNDNIVESVTTDVYGYYVFNDVSAGNYSVEVVSANNYLPSLGEDGYEVTMVADTVIGNLDFGLCNLCLFDEEPPMVNCSESLVTYSLGNNGSVDLNPDLHGIEFEDNCEIASIDYSQTSFSCNDLTGIPYSVQIVAIDAAGNMANCEIMVLIEDPGFSCIPDECDPACYSGFIDLSTGINNLNSELPIGSYVGNWQLIDGPDDNVNYPRPGYVLNPHNAWDQLTGSQYISPFPNASNNESFDEPYLFERCFCICEDQATVNLDLSVHVDNFINVGLYDDSGILIEELIVYDGPSNSNTFRDPAFESHTIHNLNSGTYCLRAGLRNDSSTAMGMSINAAVSNAGFISSECCNPFGFIIGSVFEDTECDSIFNLTADPGIEGILVSLFADDSIIATSTTDQFGYFIFSDIESGSYSIWSENINGSFPTLGMNGVIVEMISDTVVADIDFGFCSISEPCCATSNELTSQAQIGLNSDIIDLEEGCNLIVNLNNPQLLNCQYVSAIYWGDGIVETFESFQNLPSHDYNGGGSYLITFEVTSKLENGEVCQVDEVQHIISIKDCISSTSFVDPTISTVKIYPIPFNESVQIDFSLNDVGYILELFNTSGQLIDQLEIESGIVEYQYDSSNLPSGSYLFKFQSVDGQHSLQAKAIKI